MTEETHYEESIRYVNALKKLIASEGWKIFVDISHENIHDRREQIVLQPLSSMDETLPTEFMKGEVAGITAMLLYPGIKIEECEGILESLKEPDDGEEEEGGS